MKQFQFHSTFSRLFRPNPWIAALRQKFNHSYPSLCGYRLMLGWEKTVKSGHALSPSFPCKPRFVGWCPRVYVPAWSASLVGWVSCGRDRHCLTAATEGCTGAGSGVKVNSLWFCCIWNSCFGFLVYYSRAPACRPVDTFVGPRCVIAVCPASADPPFQHINL